MIDARVQAADFEPGRRLQRIEELGATGVASAIIAARTDPAVRELLIDHDPALARNMLAAIASEAEARSGLSGIILIHRHGVLVPGERIAFAATCADDPQAALEGCAFTIEALGRRAPFWRKEVREDGSSAWR